MIKGKCHCQTVKYESSNDSESAVFCHCQTCREINGSAFGSSAVVPRKGFEIISGKNSLVGYESSSGKKRFFVLIVELTFMRPLQRNLKILYLELVV